MSMGRRQKPQLPLWIAHHELAQSPGHRFYETLNALLRDAALDRHAEALCAPYYEAAHVSGRKSVAPGVYFRMHLVGFFEGIESERAWSGALPTPCPCASSWGSRSRSASPTTRR
jgi:transposase